MKIAKFLIIPAIALLIYVVVFPPHYSWRQKLTVTVSTPHGLVEGSAVTQVDVYDMRHHSFGLPEASTVNSSFTGEAVAVEIAPGRMLFVLLMDESGYGGPNDWPNVIWAKSAMSFEEVMARVNDQHGKPGEVLPQKHWPLMATFDDISHPETLHIVKGSDLSAWFGPGVRVEGMTLEITHEPLTKGRIEAILPWLLPAGFERGPVALPPTPFLPLTAFLSSAHWQKK